MRKALQILVSLLVVLAAFIWVVAAMRELALLVLLVAAASLLIGPFRRRRLFPVSAWSLFVVVMLVPYDVTLRNVPGPPRFVRCCPGAPYYDLADTIRRADAGECELCSDVVSGFEPTWYLVW
jgi:hypothetical protein